MVVGFAFAHSGDSPRLNQYPVLRVRATRWENDYHPIATAVAVTATFAVTSAVMTSKERTVPATLPGKVPNYKAAQSRGLVV
jgi:hypothetical protein